MKKHTALNNGHGRLVGVAVRGDAFHCVYHDGHKARASLADLRIKTTPKVVAAHPDEFGAGFVFRRADGTEEDVGADFILHVNESTFDPAEEDRAREELKARTAKNIRAVRESKGRTQAWMAARLGLAVPNYSRLESGRHMADLSVLLRAAKLLGVSWDAFLGEAAPTHIALAWLAPGSHLVLTERVAVTPPKGVTVEFSDAEGQQRKRARRTGT